MFSKRTAITAALIATFLASTPRVFAEENPWAKLLERDLEAVHRALVENHPGPVDPLNKDFSGWLEAGYRQGLERAKRCDSYDGYRFALEAYAAGFRDGHLSVWTDLRREDARWRWPGFLVGWDADGKKLRVRVVGEGKAGEGAPAIGSEVVSCDGKPARELIERDVFSFWGDPALEAGWNVAGPQWLIDESNPWRAPVPRTCKFLDKGQARDHVLRWRDGSAAELRVYRGKARDRAKVEFGVRSFGERGVWVAMPSFTTSDAAAGAALEAAIQRASTWRDRDPIVFDVRTNGGGSSLWGRRMLETLYGKDFVAARYDSLVAKEYVEWRVSPGNVEHVKGMIATVARIEGAGSPAEARERSKAAGMERALAQGKALWREDEGARRVTPAAARLPANPVTGRVFLLTDAGCGSACLDFADLVRAMPGTQHVGRTTGADSVYMEGRTVLLPSGVAHLFLPTKVYRNRPRGNNQPYVPHHLWKGDIADTAALERWILSLPAR